MTSTAGLMQILLNQVHILFYTVSQKNDNDVAHYNFNAH